MLVKHMPARTRKGTVLLTAVMTLMIVATTGMAIVTLTLHGLHTTRHIQGKMVAFNLAESGMDRSIRWLQNQATPPDSDTAFDPFDGDQLMDGGSYSVVIVPDPINVQSTLKKFRIIATGVSGAERDVVELVVRQASFGKYAYFTDQETSPFSGGRIWFFSGDKIRGPAHSNSRNGSEMQINWGQGSGPIFEGHLTTSGAFINFKQTAPTTEAEFGQIFLEGSRGYELGVDPIDLPDSTFTQKVAAWGLGGAFPTTDGVYTPPDGGIYIKGDSEIVMMVDASGNQVFEVTQGTTVTVLTIDLVNDVTIRQVDGGAPLYLPGSGNGVVYSAGNITSLYGTIADNVTSGYPLAVDKRNSFTIATDVNAGMNITVTAPVKHLTQLDLSLPPGDPANLQSGTLGLIGRNVFVGKNAPPDMEIDALILAGSVSTPDGSFEVESFRTKRPTGTLKVLGGIIQKMRGPVGTIGRGGLISGYAKDYYYDSRMADNPPPFFPTTGSYDRLSWRRLVDHLVISDMK